MNGELVYHKRKIELPLHITTLGEGFFKDYQTGKVYDGKLNELVPVRKHNITGELVYKYNNIYWTNPGYNYGCIQDDIIKGIGRYVLEPCQI